MDGLCVRMERLANEGLEGRDSVWWYHLQELTFPVLCLLGTPLEDTLNKEEWLEKKKQTQNQGKGEADWMKRGKRDEVNPVEGTGE